MKLLVTTLLTSAIGATALVQSGAQNPEGHSAGDKIGSQIKEQPMSAHGGESDSVEVVYEADFQATVERVRHAIEAAGLRTFAEIDHSAAAAGAHLTMPPTLVLIYGRAEGGTPIMLAAPNAALDLPLRVLVREQQVGRTVVVFHPIAATLQRTGVPQPLVHRLDPAQQIIVDALR